MPQLVTRIDDDLAADLDELVAAGAVASRSEAVRVALERFIDRYRRDEIGTRIVEGYRATPQTDEELRTVDDLTVRMIADEPW